MNKQEFKDKAKQTIDNFTQEVDKLENNIQKMKIGANTAVSKKLNDLRQQKEVLVEKFDQLEQSTEQNWETTKEAFSNGVRAFRETLAR